MSNETKLRNEDILNKGNFENWEFLINNILKSLKILKYVNENVIGNLNDKLKEEKEKPQTDETNKAIKDLEKDIKEAEAQDALASTIISKNVNQEALSYIRYLTTAYDIMEKLKTLYGKKKTADLNYWLKKLYSFKAKDLSDCKDVINQINEIFNVMDKSNIKLGTWEKIRILYLSYPKALRDLVHPDGTETLKDFLEDSTNKINFHIYLHSTINFDRSTKGDEDFMDIDNVEPCRFKNNKRKPSPEPNYCYLCKVFGHNTDDCKFNLINKNKINSNKTNNKKPSSNKRKPKNNKRKGKNSQTKSIANVEYEEYNSDEGLSLEELRTMYDKTIDNFEPLEEKENTKENCDDRCVSLVLNSSGDTTVWTFDIGDSEHITNNKEILSNFREEKISMQCANNSICQFDGVGTYEGSINGYNIKFENVLYSKQVNKNLLSGIKLAKNGLKCNIKARKDNIYLTLKTKLKNKRTVNIGTFKANKNNTIHIDTKNKQNIMNCIDIISHEETKEINEESKMLWHRRLGHFYNENLTKYLKLHNIKINECLDCKIAKLNRKPHNGNTPKAKHPLDVIHSDVMGPISKSYTGKRYILTFIDEFTRKSWIFLLENKSEIPRTVVNFFTYLNNQFYYQIKTFHSDQGTEYNNKKILNYCKEQGIIKTFSPPHNPQNNGIAERFNYTIVSCAKTLIQWSKMSTEFWDYAIKYANLLYNITPHKGIENKIPNEVYYNKKVNLKYIKVFGCEAYYKDFSQEKKKFDSNSKKGTFLGLSIESNCYIIMDSNDYSIHLVREAVFDEETPSKLTTRIHNNKLPTNIFNNDNYIFELPIINNNEKDNTYDDSGKLIYDEEPSKDNIESKEKISSSSGKGKEPESDTSVSSTKGKEIENSYFSDNPNESLDDLASDLQSIRVSNDEPSSSGTVSINKEETEFSKSKTSSNSNTQAEKKINLNKESTSIVPFKHKLVHTKFPDSKKLKPSMNESSKRPGTPIYPNNNKKYKISLDNVETLKGYLTESPLTYRQAISRKDKDLWIEAMNSELQNFYDNNTMTFVKKLPPGIKPTTTKWVYTIKKDGNGNISKYKARLVARGFTQKKGIDYDLTYSPTLSIDSLKLIIALASKLNWDLMQLDIKAAYLNAPLDKNIYVTIPPGDVNFGKGYWLLRKALYGLKQSGRQWNIHFTNFLKNNGFIQLISEPCIFVKKEGERAVCIIGVYVDDLLITGIQYHINKTIKNIKKNFKVSKCNEAGYILGINIEKKKY